MRSFSVKLAVIIGMGILVIGIGATAFFHKMTEFVRTIIRHDVEGFGIISLVSYLTGVLSLLCVTLWGIVKGHFRHLEAPKHRMFELDAEVERRGNVFRESEVKREPRLNVIRPAK